MVYGVEVMKPIIAYLLILFYFLWLADITNSDVRIVTETSYGKEVNGRTIFVVF